MIKESKRKKTVEVEVFVTTVTCDAGCGAKDEYGSQYGTPGLLPELKGWAEVRPDKHKGNPYYICPKCLSKLIPKETTIS